MGTGYAWGASTIQFFVMAEGFLPVWVLGLRAFFSVLGWGADRIFGPFWRYFPIFLLFPFHNEITDWVGSCRLPLAIFCYCSAQIIQVIQLFMLLNPVFRSFIFLGRRKWALIR